MSETSHPDQERVFRALHASVYLDLLRFVQRRTHPDSAEDVVAEALLVAWRRLDELPRREDDARAWVFGIARNVLLNAQRGARRQQALGVRLAAAATTVQAPSGVDQVVDRVQLSRAWDLLGYADGTTAAVRLTL